MRVGMAIHADQLAGLVRSVPARRLMTLLARQFEMFTLQLESTLLVRIACEERGFELQFVMAGVTVCARRAAFELAVVNVFMAIATKGVRHRSPEIIIFVTLRAVRFGVFPMQRKLGASVIEGAGWGYGLPARGRVAGLARALERRVLEGAAVRIGVAILTISKRQALIMRGGFTRLGPVTACAGHVLVQSRERERRTGMVEALGWLPSFLTVAAQALRP